MNICVIGTGYVGLVVGTCLADFGNHVVCVDSDQRKIDMLRQGDLPIYEIGLSDIVKRNTAGGRLEFSTDLSSAVQDSLVVFIAVGTAPAEDGSADLSSVYAVAEQVGNNMDGYKVVVNKSTVPVGTGTRVTEIIRAQQTTAQDFTVVSNPEFLREGSAIEDFLKPDRVVLGTDDPHAEAIMRDIYRRLSQNNTPFLVTTRETAEMIKYAANAFLATKISFINEIANLCELVGADVRDVAYGMGSDARIGPSFLQAGPGYGGSCLPKDTRALRMKGEQEGYSMQVIDAVIRVNENQSQRIIEKIRRGAGGDLSGKTVGILGLSFKPNTDDMRDAPSLAIIPFLQQEGAHVKAFDPVSAEEAGRFLSEVEFSGSAYDAADGCDVLLVLTEWNEFRDLDFQDIKERMRQPVLVDAKNIYDPAALVAAGFEYYGVGRSA
ncbi:MAG: UDP-glucose/GDP-mannose dehydrogenase family protein [Candidatus Latescibacteria bacterium]|nr:UDP-glucose/GDP-mannose dehydrogenase family protein [Candidatus Latescibacterota bacterium]